MSSSPEGGSLPSKEQHHKNPHGEHQEQQRLVDTSFLPCLIQQVFHHVVGQYLFQSDDFVTLIRKVCAIAYLIGGIMGLAGVPFYLFLSTRDMKSDAALAAGKNPTVFGGTFNVPDLIIACSFLVFSLTVLAAYGFLRVQKAVSDKVIVACVLGAGQLVTCLTFFSSDFDVVFFCTVLLAFVILNDCPGKPLFNAWWILLQFIAYFNKAFDDSVGRGNQTSSSTNFVFRHPDVRHREGVMRFLITASGWPGMICIFFCLQGVLNENKKQFNVAKRSTLLAQKVVAELRSYNTDQAQEVVDAEAQRLLGEEAAVRGISGGEEKNKKTTSATTYSASTVDPSTTTGMLVHSFQELVYNLDSYRPFLPNYILNTTSRGREGILMTSDDEEEEDVDDVDAPFRDPEAEDASGGSGSQSNIRSQSSPQAAQQQNKSRSSTDFTTIAISNPLRRMSNNSKSPLVPGLESPLVRGLRPTFGGSSRRRSSSTSQQQQEKVSRFYDSKVSFALVDLHFTTPTPTTTINCSSNKNKAGDGGALSNFILDNPGSPSRSKSHSKESIQDELRQQHQHQNFDLLSTVVDAIYTIAKSTHASVHSMLGDTVQLTWNATHSVSDPESKSAIFLTKLHHEVDTITQAVSRYGVPSAGVASVARVSGAVVTSSDATVHSIMSSQQRAFIVDFDKLKALHGCFDLARRHGAMLMDEETALGASAAVESCAVETVSFYKEKEEEDNPLTPPLANPTVSPSTSTSLSFMPPNWVMDATALPTPHSFLFHNPRTPPSSTQPHTKHRESTVVYQILREKTKRKSATRNRQSKVENSQDEKPDGDAGVVSTPATRLLHLINLFHQLNSVQDDGPDGVAIDDEQVRGDRFAATLEEIFSRAGKGGKKSGDRRRSSSIEYVAFCQRSFSTVIQEHIESMLPTEEEEYEKRGDPGTAPPSPKS